MSLVVAPGAVRGRLWAPPSKSYTHRALVAAAALDRSITVVRPLEADDTRRTRDGLRRIGYQVWVGPRSWRVGPGPSPGRVRRAVTVPCGESGTTLRFLAALAARQARPVRLTGSARLGERPIVELLDALEALGARARRRPGPPWSVEVEGPISAGAVRIRGARSSQFVSALLLALAGLDAPSRVRPVGPTVSAPYIDATVASLRSLGATPRAVDGGWQVGGPRRGRAPARFVVPGDASSAAYLWAAAASGGGWVEVRGIDRRWPQADLAVLPLLARAGAQVAWRGDGVRVTGPATRGFTATFDDAPDLLPLAGALAAGLPGPSTLRGASHATLKESDRRTSSAALAEALGATTELGPHRLRIQGHRPSRPLRRWPSTDHRLVAAGAIAALGATGPSTIASPGAVRKSYPGLWTDLRRLGVRIRRGP